MNNLYALAPEYPEWYKIERETGKSINKLTTTKELGFYLRNPDEYIRRLAILRICELKLKDSIDVLKEILDDRLETITNKELAAWAIKCISTKWDVDIFINNRLLGKYTGSERYEDLYKVAVLDNDIKIKYEFMSKINELSLDNVDYRRCEDISFETPFPYKDWLSSLYSEYSAVLKKLLTNLPRKLLALIGKLFPIVLAAIFMKLPRLIFLNLAKWIKMLAMHRKSKERSSNRYNSFARSRKSPLEVIKKFVFNLLYVIFSPVRILYTYRKYALILILSTYIYLTFTTSGKILTYKYFNLDLSEVQSSVLSSVKDFSKYAVSEFQSIAGIEEKVSLPVETHAQTPAPVKHEIQFRIIASKGLNLRTLPDGKAEKVTGGMLTYNSIVYFLSNEKKDASGNIWYNVQTPGGKTGWVISKWLEKVGGV